MVRNLIYAGAIALLLVTAGIIAGPAIHARLQALLGTIAVHKAEVEAISPRLALSSSGTVLKGSSSGVTIPDQHGAGLWTIPDAPQPQWIGPTEGNSCLVQDGTGAWVWVQMPVPHLPPAVRT